MSIELTDKYVKVLESPGSKTATPGGYNSIHNSITLRFFNVNESLKSMSVLSNLVEKKNHELSVR